MSRGHVVTGTLAVLLIMGLAACGGDQPTLESPSTGGTTTSTATIDPAAQPAVDAYVQFVEKLGQAKLHPTTGELPPEADFTQYSFDPARGMFLGDIINLANASTAYQGTPPQPRVEVVSVDLEATPYPTVILTDCYFRSPDWLTYDVRNGKVLQPPSVTIPPPYLNTITMIEAEGHWGFQDLVSDQSKTCTR